MEKESDVESAIGTKISLLLPDDFHHHCRDGTKTKTVIEHAMQQFGKCMMMPNTNPPIVNTQMALEYHEHIMKQVRELTPASTAAPTSLFEPLMTLYLTDRTEPAEVEKAFLTKKVIACKYYPAGATTNSKFGVTDPKNIHSVLSKMEEIGMMLCIHSEVTHGDIFMREPTFVNEIMIPLVNKFPKLKITMEHISTKQAVDYILHSSPPNVRASITCHHLLYNRNHLLVGGIKPHLYCLPILKAETDRVALLVAATSGSDKFFLGTDSAPHPINSKHCPVGCAGIYTAHAALQLYAEAFDSVGKIAMLENFASVYGQQHYFGTAAATAAAAKKTTITLEKKAWTVPKSYFFGEGNQDVVPLRANEAIKWSIV